MLYPHLTAIPSHGMYFFMHPINHAAQNITDRLAWQTANREVSRSHFRLPDEKSGRVISKCGCPALHNVYY